MKIHHVFLAWLVALAGLQAGWHAGSTIGWLAIGWGVILILPGFWVARESIRAAGASCLISLPFFVHGVTEAVASETARTWALIETGLCTALYVTLILWVIAKRRRSGATG